MFAAILTLFDLTGQTAIITGTGQGMGRGIALRLAQAGALLVVTGRTLAKSETVAAEICAEVRSHRGNVRCDDLIPRCIDQNPWAHWRSPMDMIR